MSKYLKIIVFVVTIILVDTRAEAFGKLRFSFDWGYKATLAQSWWYNYDAEEGYRVDQHGHDAIYNSNGLIRAFFGTSLGRHCEFGIVSGYEGIRQDRQVVPVGLRTGWMFNGLDCDGPMCYVEGGAAFHTDCEPTSNIVVGSGWHWQLDHGTGLDLRLNLHRSGDHPDIKGVPSENVRRSDSHYMGISLTIGICF